MPGSVGVAIVRKVRPDVAELRGRSGRIWIGHYRNPLGSEPVTEQDPGLGSQISSAAFRITDSSFWPSTVSQGFRSSACGLH